MSDYFDALMRTSGIRAAPPAASTPEEVAHIGTRDAGDPPGEDTARDVTGMTDAAGAERLHARLDIDELHEWREDSDDRVPLDAPPAMHSERANASPLAPRAQPARGASETITAGAAPKPNVVDTLAATPTEARHGTIARAMQATPADEEVRHAAVRAALAWVASDEAVSDASAATRRSADDNVALPTIERATLRDLPHPEPISRSTRELAPVALDTQRGERPRSTPLVVEVPHDDRPAPPKSAWQIHRAAADVIDATTPEPPDERHVDISIGTISVRVEAATPPLAARPVEPPAPAVRTPHHARDSRLRRRYLGPL